DLRDPYHLFFIQKSSVARPLVRNEQVSLLKAKRGMATRDESIPGNGQIVVRISANPEMLFLDREPPASEGPANGYQQRGRMSRSWRREACATLELPGISRYYSLLPLRFFPFPWREDAQHEPIDNIISDLPVDDRVGSHWFEPGIISKFLPEIVQQV